MPVEFLCAHCSHRLMIARRKVGTEIECPKCDAPVVVPDEVTAAAAIAMAESAKARRKQERRARLSGAAGNADPFGFLNGRTGSLWETEVRPAPRISAQAAAVQVAGDHLTVSRRTLFAQGILVAVVGVVAFVAGLTIGRGSAMVLPPKQDRPVGERVLVQGKVTYRNAAEEQLPDSGAIVLAVPSDRFPDATLDAALINPVPDRGVPQESLTQLADLGAEYAVCGPDGGYSFILPGTGGYYVLVISKQVGPGPPDKLEDVMLAALRKYITEPEGVLAAHRYAWRTETFREQLATVNVDFKTAP